MLPTEKELLEFIEKRDNLVNFSMIAKQFGIKNTTVSDIISALQKKKVVVVKVLGSSKVVVVGKK